MALAWPGGAQAAAWMNPGQSITTGLLREEDGELQGEVDQYFERRIAQGVGVVTRGFAASQSDFAAPGQRAWAGQAALAGKLALHSGRQSVAAVELGPVYTSEANPACRGWGGELRGLAGASLGRAFVNLEAAYLAQTPACVHAKLEVAGGARLTPRWQVIGQAFTDRNYAGGYAAKTQVSLVRQARAGGAVQLGVRWRIDGQAHESPAILLGFWAAPRSAH
jgi:hypothetical protein